MQGLHFRVSSGFRVERVYGNKGNTKFWEKETGGNL